MGFWYHRRVMTSIENQVDPTPARDRSGPDPVVGAGITLFGIFLMGTGGARDAHYVFDVGVLFAVIGAGVFVVSVALSAMKQRS